jgi:hypothetical protein
LSARYAFSGGIGTYYLDWALGQMSGELPPTSGHVLAPMRAVFQKACATLRTIGGGIDEIRKHMIAKWLAFPSGIRCDRTRRSTTCRRVGKPRRSR